MAEPIETRCARCKWKDARIYDNANDLDHEETDVVYWMLRGYCLDCSKPQAEKFRKHVPQ